MWESVPFAFGEAVGDAGAEGGEVFFEGGTACVGFDGLEDDKMEFISYALGFIVLGFLVVVIIGLEIGIELASKWKYNLDLKILMAIIGFVIGGLVGVFIVTLVYGFFG